MKPSKQTREIEARRAADPIAQELGRTDIDYSSDDLPTAPRFTGGQKPVAREAKYPTPFLDDLLAAGEITRAQHERLRRENK